MAWFVGPSIPPCQPRSTTDSPRLAQARPTSSKHSPTGHSNTAPASLRHRSPTTASTPTTTSPDQRTVNNVLASTSSRSNTRAVTRARDGAGLIQQRVEDRADGGAAGGSAPGGDLDVPA